MANVDLWGIVILLRYLKEQGQITKKEANIGVQGVQTR